MSGDTFYDINQSSERGNLGVYPYKYDIFASDYYIYQPALILNSSDLDFVIETNQNTPLDIFLPNSTTTLDSADITNVNNAFRAVFESTDAVSLVTSSASSASSASYYTCENVSLKLNPENSSLNTDYNISAMPFSSMLQTVLESRSRYMYGSQACFNISGLSSEITDSLCSQSVNNLITSFSNSDGSNDLVDFWSYSHTNSINSNFFHKGDTLVMLYDINLDYKTRSGDYTAINNVDYSVNIFCDSLLFK